MPEWVGLDVRTPRLTCVVSASSSSVALQAVTRQLGAPREFVRVHAFQGSPQAALGRLRLALAVERRKQGARVPGALTASGGYSRRAGGSGP